MLLKIQHQQGFNTDDFFVCTNKWKQAKQTLNLDFFPPFIFNISIWPEFLYHHL